jgi:hypothetical protein
MTMLDNILFNTGIKSAVACFSGKTITTTVSVNNIKKNMGFPQLQRLMAPIASATEYSLNLATVPLRKHEAASSVKVIAMSEAPLNFAAKPKDLELPVFKLSTSLPTVSHIAQAVLKYLFPSTLRILQENNLYAKVGGEIWNSTGTQSADRLGIGAVLKIPKITEAIHVV